MLAAGCGGSDPFQIRLQRGPATPGALEWATAVGVSGGIAFIEPFGAAELNGGSPHSVALAPKGNPAYGVAFGGSSSGTWVSQGFGGLVNGKNDEMLFILGGDLLSDPLAPVVPVAAAAGPLLSVDKTIVHLTATPSTPGAADVHIGNVGSSTSANLRIVPVGPGASNYTLVGCAGQALPAGTGCTLHVVFAAREGQIGSRLAAVAIDSGTSELQTLVLVGSALGDPLLTMASPGNGNFGTVERNSASTAQPVLVGNSGGSPTSAVTLSIEGPDAASFELDAHDCAGSGNAPQPIGANGSCTAGVIFKPQHLGPLQAVLVARADVGGSASLPLSGVGHIPLTLSVVGSGDAGPVETGHYAEFQIDVRNDGLAATGPLTFSISKDQPFLINSYYTGPGDCQANLPLAPGAVCVVHLSAWSLMNGPNSGKMLVTGEPGGYLEVPLSVTPGHFTEISVDGHALDSVTDVVLGSLTAPNATSSRLITVRNVSAIPLPITVTDTGWMTITAASPGNCTGTLNPGSSCVFTVSATAGAGVQYGAAYYDQVIAQVAGSQYINLDVWYSMLQVSTAHVYINSYNDNVGIGSFTVTNVASTTAITPTVSLSQANAGYSFQHNGCVAPLAFGQSCTVTVAHDISTPTSGPQPTFAVTAPNQGSFTVQVY